MLVEGRNCAVSCSGIGGVYRLSVSRADESGVMWLVVWQCLSSIQPPPHGVIHNKYGTEEDFGRFLFFEPAIIHPITSWHAWDYGERPLKFVEQ